MTDDELDEKVCAIRKRYDGMDRYKEILIPTLASDANAAKDVIDELMKRAEDTTDLRIVCVRCESAQRARNRTISGWITPGGGTEKQMMQFVESKTTHPPWSVYECPACFHRIEIQKKWRPYSR
jgi:hypothetical protein